ncbi:MAG: radical SAM protein [Deltaproteobacteria bacterium]|nr:radical SAM protein [Deltaproteobacteria bacterium]
MDLAKTFSLAARRRLCAPYKLTFSVTDRCNMSCSHCGIWRKKPENELNSDEIREFFALNRGFRWIDITGGEPFLRDDIVEIFEAILNTQAHLALLHFPTNGWHTDGIVECAKWIKKKFAGKFVVTVSLDGDKETHERVRGKPGSWEKAVETLLKLRSERVETYFGFTFTNENLFSFEKAIASARAMDNRLRAADFHLNIQNISPHYFNNTDMVRINRRETAGALKRAAAKRGIPFTAMEILEHQYLKKACSFLMRTDGAEEDELPACEAGRSSLFVNPQGIVYPCHIFDMPVLSLRKSGFRLTGNGEMKEALALIDQKKCPECWTPCEAYQSIFAFIFRKISGCNV